MIRIASLFFHIDTLISASPVGDGNINDTYQLVFLQEGKTRSVLLQRLNHLVFKQPETVTENTNRICQYLATQDYPYQIAQPIPGIDGDFLQVDEAGNYWRVFRYLENTFAPEGPSDVHIALEAARAYGAFANALRDFPADTLHETIPGFHDTDRRWEGFMGVLETDPVGRAAETQVEIEAMYRIKPVFDQISRMKKSGELPLRVSHNDTKAGNVLFDRTTRKAVAVIDLDTVMPGTVLSDFGDMVRTFGTDCPEDSETPPKLRKDIIAALKKGFEQDAAGFLSDLEKESLMLGATWIAGEQALRFLTDWLAGDVYYKIKFPEHNLVRTRNQLALAGCLQAEL